MCFSPLWLMSICSLINLDSVISLPCDSDFYLKLGNFIAFRPFKLILHLCPVTKGHFRDSVPSSWGVAHVWVSDLHFLVWSSLSTITAAAVGVHLCGEMQKNYCLLQLVHLMATRHCLQTISRHFWSLLSVSPFLLLLLLLGPFSLLLHHRQYCSSETA